jgi:hypothetical protein
LILIHEYCHTLQEAPGEESAVKKDVARGGAETSLSRELEALGWALDVDQLPSIGAGAFLGTALLRLAKGSCRL